MPIEAPDIDVTMAQRQAGAAGQDVSALYQSTRDAASIIEGTLTAGTRAARLGSVGMQAGDRWIETDTGWEYRYTGTAWAFNLGLYLGTDAQRGAITPNATDEGAPFFATDTGRLWEVVSAAWAEHDITAKKVRETGGPTNLALGAVADGQFLKRSGSSVVGASVSAAVLAVATKTGAYTLTDADDVILVDASGGAVTITLHAVATAVKKPYYFKKMDAAANAMTLDGAGAETVDGAATLATTVQYTAFTLFPTGSEWVVL